MVGSMSGSGCLLGDDAFSFTLFEDLCLVVGRDWICSTLTVYVTNTYSMKLDVRYSHRLPLLRASRSRSTLLLQ